MIWLPRAGRSLTAVALLAPLLVAGCSESHDAGSELPSPSPVSAGPTGPPVIPRARDLTWSTLDWWGHREEPTLASSKYVVTRSKDRRIVRVRDSASGKTVFTHSAPGGFEVANTFLEGSTLVVENSTPMMKPRRRPDRVAVIDLGTGAVRSLSRNAPEPDGPGTTWSLGPRGLTYGTNGPDESFCLARVSLKTLDGDRVDCLPRGNGFDHVEQSPYGIAYATFNNQRPVPCGGARALRGPGHLVDLIDETRCDVWQAIALKGRSAIWTEVHDPGMTEFAELWVRSRTGDETHLGTVDTNSLTWCAGYVWFTRESSVVLRWSPERGPEETLHASQAEEVPMLFSPVCSSGQVSIVEVRPTPDGELKEVLHLATLP